ncbi:outer membrane beta-barrel family protein [Hymenobacter psychrophilus]|nr:outer membrane beta-barrel family protein [Hymenobacter psychrophilus]
MPILCHWLGLLCWLLPGWVAAQGTLSGTVTDGTAPVAWANVVLFTPAGQLVAATATTEQGRFELQAAPGAYQLKVSFLGFSDWEQPVVLAAATTLGTIILKTSATALREVTVVGQKALVEYQPDRVIFNVENSAAATGGDAVQALSAAPGVLVRNNSISLLGRGAVRVLVNGRLLELAGEELVAYLKAIPASSIRNVEVMSNPPAEYEADGAGLLNINLRQGAADSWKNTSTLSYEQNTYGSLALRNNLIYNQGRIRFAGSVGGKLGNSQARQTLTTAYPSGLWNLRYTGRQQENNASARLALDYDLTPNLSVGGQYAGTYATPGSQDYTTIDIRNRQQRLDSLVRNTDARRVRTSSHAYNAHLVSVLDTLQRQLSVDADYFTYDSELDNTLIAKVFTPEEEFVRTSLAARNDSYQQVRTGSVKADMTHPLLWAQLSYGGKISLISSQSGLAYYDIRPATPQLDPSRSNTFEYREQTQALYVSGTRPFSARMSLQLGLRLENTQTRGYSATLDQRTTRSYRKLFPSAYLTYQPSDDHRFRLTYGRRVNRPGFGLLNPFRSYINSNSYSEGNPFLQPSFANNLELTYAYKNAWRTNAFLTHTVAGFGPVFTAEPATNTLTISRQNYFREYAYGLGQSYTAPVTAWWQTQTQLYGLSSATQFSNGLAARPRNGIQLYGATTNTFTLGPATTLQADYTYASPVARGLYRMGYTSGLNLALQHQFLHNRLHVTALLNDAFNTAYLKDYSSTVNGIRQVYSENNSSRFFRLTLSYDIGNSLLQGKQREFGNEDERQRTR